LACRKTLLLKNLPKGRYFEMILYLIPLALLLGADQWLKHWTVTHLELGQSAPLLPGLMRLTRLHNYGAAWSSFSGATILLIVVTAVLIVAVAYLLLRKIVRHPLGRWAGVLILAGGIGNLIDRAIHVYVVDMFELTFMQFPIFNLADCFVVVGAILGAIYYLWFYEKYDKKGNDHGTSHPLGDK
jgi:signal peptidase II